MKDANERPVYVIIDEIDAPERKNVCQLVAGVGYCYMERDRRRTPFDGMSGQFSTPIERFGFSVIESDYEVRFTRTSESTAKYQDGMPRRWQDSAHFGGFVLPRVTRTMVRKRRAA